MRLINITFVSSLANRSNVCMVPCEVMKRLACERDDILSPSCCEEGLVHFAAVDRRAEGFRNLRFTGADTMATDVEGGAHFLTLSEFATSAELDRKQVR